MINTVSALNNFAYSMNLHILVLTHKDVQVAAKHAIAHGHKKLGRRKFYNARKKN